MSRFSLIQIFTGRFDSPLGVVMRNESGVTNVCLCQASLHCGRLPLEHQLAPYRRNAVWANATSRSRIVAVSAASLLDNLLNPTQCDSCRPRQEAPALAPGKQEAAQLRADAAPDSVPISPPGREGLWTAFLKSADIARAGFARDSAWALALPRRNATAKVESRACGNGSPTSPRPSNP